jgi:hypothetical protein
MNNVGSPPTSSKQFAEPILSGNVPEDRALWNLSLVLLEIAEKRQNEAITEPQNQFNVGMRRRGTTTEEIFTALTLANQRTAPLIMK